MSEQGKKTDNVFCSLWTKSKALENALSPSVTWTNSDKRNKKQGSIGDTQTQKEPSGLEAKVQNLSKSIDTGNRKRGKLPPASQRVSDVV